MSSPPGTLLAAPLSTLWNEYSKSFLDCQSFILKSSVFVRLYDVFSVTFALIGVLCKCSLKILGRGQYNIRNINGKHPISYSESVVAAYPAVLPVPRSALVTTVYTRVITSVVPLRLLHISQEMTTPAQNAYPGRSHPLESAAALSHSALTAHSAAHLTRIAF